MPTSDEELANTGLILDLLAAVVQDDKLPDDWPQRIADWANSTDDWQVSIVSLAGLALASWGQALVQFQGRTEAQVSIEMMRLNRLLGAEDWSRDV